MRYKITEDIDKLFITTSNLNLIFNSGDDPLTGFIDTIDTANIYTSGQTIYFSENDDDKPVTDTRIVLPNHKFRSIYIAPYNGYARFSSVWLEELRIRLADDRVEAHDLRLDNLDIMASRAYVDMNLLGSSSSYQFELKCGDFTMETEPSAEVMDYKLGSIKVKNQGKTKLLFRGYSDEK